MFTEFEKKIIDQAVSIIESKAKVNAQAFTGVDCVRNYLMCSLAHNEREVFKVLLLDSQHRLIAAPDLFKGTIDAAAVYPREILKVALEHNAAAIIIAHNHPSGIPEPSQADIMITGKIKEALSFIDVNLLDHFVIGVEGVVSLAQRGLI